MTPRSNKAPKKTLRLKSTTAQKPKASSPKSSPKDSRKGMKTPSIAKGKPAATKKAAPKKKTSQPPAVTKAATPRVVKKAPPKTAAVQAPPPSSQTIEPVAAPAAEVPTRQPTRKIFGPDNKVISLAERRPAAKPVSVQEVASASPSGTISLADILQPEATKLPQIDLSALSGPQSTGGKSIEIALPSFTPIPTVTAPENPPTSALPKVLWTELPSSIDKELRKTITQLREQCATAATSPFPFAKFIYALPTEICALQFATLLLDLDTQDLESSIAAKLGTTPTSVQELQTEASANLSDLFAQKCPVMFRNWKAQLAGRVVAAQTLIEQHLLGAIDREFQLLITRVVLRAFGVKPQGAPTKAAQG